MDLIDFCSFVFLFSTWNFNDRYDNAGVMVVAYCLGTHFVTPWFAEILITKRISGALLLTFLLALVSGFLLSFNLDRSEMSFLGAFLCMSELRISKN